jgi:hypothetical protein
MNKNKDSCSQHGQMCLWELTNPAKPLFTEEFCHPGEIKKTVTTVGILDKCIGKSSTECAAPCVFNNGADLIPDHDYCAPKEMTKDTAIIMQCTDADSIGSCVEPNCQWRKGKVVASNDDF